MDSSGDSSDDNEPTVKRTPARSSSAQQSNNVLHRDHDWVANSYNALRQGKRKTNNIWGSVLQEQSISSCVRSLQANDNVDYTERGCESYDFTRAKLVDRSNSSNENDHDTRVENAGNDSNAVDLDKLETFATVKQPQKKQSNRVEKTRRGSHDERKPPGRAQHEGDLRNSLSRKRPIVKNNPKTAKPMRLGVSLDGLNRNNMAYLIADALHEPKDNVQVLGKINMNQGTAAFFF